MFVNLVTRVYLNVEALNMVESIGNYTRHRRVPIVFKELVKRGDGEEHRVVLRYVPAVSGESLAHAYQEILASIASEMGLRVCRRCRIGEFVKHADRNMFSGEDWEEGIINARDMFEMERVIAQNCVVEDIGGFLYVGGPAKRTSRIQFSYMVPAIDAIKSGAVASEPQFHVRYVPTMPEEQMIYYVETGSSLYTFSTLLNIGDIGRVSNAAGERVSVANDVDERVEAAVKALAILVSNALFGANRSRFTPLWKVESLVSCISRPLPFIASPGHSKSYIEETVERVRRHTAVLRDLREDVRVFYYISEEDVPKPSGEEVVECDSVEEVFERILETIRELGV